MEIQLDERLVAIEDMDGIKGGRPWGCTHVHAHTCTDTCRLYNTHPKPTSPGCGLLPEAPGLWLGGPAWRTLCCSRLRHSPRQLRVAAEVAFRSSRSWSKAVRGPEPGRDSMACTRVFCCPSTWLII
jgi:hypothetical protein